VGQVLPKKGAVKLHTLLDHAARAASGNRGSIPCFIHISDGKMHDVNALALLPIEPGTIYVMAFLHNGRKQVGKELDQRREELADFPRVVPDTIINVARRRNTNLPRPAGAFGGCP